jgi:hypothetical protein
LKAKHLLKKGGIGTILVALLLAGFVGGASFLTIQDTPVHADAVVMFIGPDLSERYREAHQLIMDGYAEVLLIPALGRIWTMRDGKWDKVLTVHPRGLDRRRRTGGHYPWSYENTHIEVLTALNMMADAGWSSAMFVSTPTHMRRIRIMTGTAFSVSDSTRYEIVFRGSRYIPSGNLLSLFHPLKAKQVVLEYIKIAWFYLYHFIAEK